MAKILGESGRYVSNAAEREWQKLITVAFAAIFIIGVLEGLVIAPFFIKMTLPTWARATLFIGAFPALYGLVKWCFRKMEDIAKKRKAFIRGADGENQVARSLTTLPDSFHVIHDLATPFGNLDHVVVGPTGVFIIDAKSWRGVVAADGKGELLINGEPTDKREVRALIARTMNIRDKVRTLAPGIDIFYQAVFAFTAARVEAKWGATGSLHCVREDQLKEYILDTKFRKALAPAQALTLAQAFLALAHMETDFTEKSDLRRGPSEGLETAARAQELTDRTRAARQG